MFQEQKQYCVFLSRTRSLQSRWRFCCTYYVCFRKHLCSIYLWCGTNSWNQSILYGDALLLFVYIIFLAVHTFPLPLFVGFLIWQILHWVYWGRGVWVLGCTKWPTGSGGSNWTSEKWISDFAPKQRFPFICWRYWVQVRDYEPIRRRIHPDSLECLPG